MAWWLLLTRIQILGLWFSLLQLSGFSQISLSQFSLSEKVGNGNISLFDFRKYIKKRHAEFGTGMHMLLYLKWITNRTSCIAQEILLNVVWKPGWEVSWGSMDECIHVAQSLCCPPETITTLLIGYIPKNKQLTRRGMQGGFIGIHIHCLWFKSAALLS